MANGCGPTDGRWNANRCTGAVTSLLTLNIIQAGEVYSLKSDAKETAAGYILLGELYADVGADE